VDGARVLLELLLRERLALDEDLGQELQRRDERRTLALDLVANRAGQVVRAVHDGVPVPLAERRRDVEVEALRGEHEDDLAVDLLRRERWPLGLLGLLLRGRRGRRRLLRGLAV